MDIRPYISLDLETTGAQDKERVEILELGYVRENGTSPIAELEQEQYLFDVSSFSYAEPFAMQMNQKILQEIADKNSTKYSPAVVFDKLLEAIERCKVEAEDWDRAHELPVKSTICLAGKNVATFDLPILRNYFKSRVHPDKFKLFEDLIQHRVIDVGSMFYEDFGYVPNSNELVKHLGLPQVNHRAMDDAMMVVKAVRMKNKVSLF